MDTKKERGLLYEVLPDGTRLDALRKENKIYFMSVKDTLPSGRASTSEEKESVLLGNVIESCLNPRWDYRKIKQICLKELEEKVRERRKPLCDTLNTHGLNVKEEELKLYLIAVHD